jgi:hypothetical protein
LKPVFIIAIVAVTMIGMLIPSAFAFEYKLTDNFFIIYDKCEREVNADNEFNRIMLSKLLNDQFRSQDPKWGICNLLEESRFEYTSSDNVGINTIKLKNNITDKIRFMNDGKNTSSLPIVLPRDWSIGDSIFSVKYNGITTTTINNQLIQIHEFEDVNYYNDDLGAIEMIRKIQYDVNSGFLVLFSIKISAAMESGEGGNMSIKLDAIDIYQKIKCGIGTESVNGICQVIQTEEKSSKGGGCLIATATYGSEMAVEVQQLRELRDNQLLQTESGTQFMGMFNDVYYSFSPIIADMEREHPLFKDAVKIAITPMISTLSLMESAESESEVLSIGISVIVLNLGMYLAVPAVVIVVIKKKF